MTTLSGTQTNTFNYTDLIETVTVGTSGYYDITAYGAQGGGDGEGQGGGFGAMASGDIYLQAGAQLEIVVGGAGGSSTNGPAGGGGGSFVIETHSPAPIDLVIAGGGGGEGVGANGTGGRTQGTGGNGSGASICRPTSIPVRKIGVPDGGRWLPTRASGSVAPRKRGVRPDLPAIALASSRRRPTKVGTCPCGDGTGACI